MIHYPFLIVLFTLILVPSSVFSALAPLPKSGRIALPYDDKQYQHETSPMRLADDTMTRAVTGSLARGMPLTVRPHLDTDTQLVYDRIRSEQAWLLGVDALGSAANAFVTVPISQVQARWVELYGLDAGLPACMEWEMAERNSAVAHRDWEGLAAFAASGGLPWVMISLNNFTVPFGAGTPPAGGMNDTHNHAAGVLPGGSGHAAFTTYIRQLAHEMKAVGRPIVFRPFHEGNGGWFWWGGNADDYKALWKMTFELFQAEGVSNVIWLWAMGDLCSGASCSAPAFYPGDAYVDMLGVDLYFDAPALPASALNTLASIETIGLDKPIFISELGPVARSDFWNQAAGAFMDIQRFRGFSLWFARGWRVWGGTSGVGSLIDGSSAPETRAAFSTFLSDQRILTLAKWKESSSSACTYEIAPAGIDVNAFSVSGSIKVRASSFACNWTAVSNVEWLTITEGSAGMGDGTVSYVVSANTPGISRTGFIILGGKTFTVTQTGAAPAASLYFSHVDTNNGWQTEIAIINTSGTERVSGILKGYTNQGQLVESKSVTLPAHGRRQIDVASEFAANTRIGYIVLEADADTIQGYIKFLINGVYRVAVPTTKDINTNDIYLTHIDSSDQWWTGVSLVNTTATAKMLTIAFSDGRTQQLSLGANEHRAFAIRELFGNQPQPGIKSAVIRNASGVVGLELFGSLDLPSGSQLEGITLTDKTTSTLYYPHIAGSGWWTGVVAYNPASTPCTITISPYSAQGDPLTIKVLTLAGKEKYIGAVADLNLPTETAWFKIQSTSPLTGFELLGSNDLNLLAGYGGGGRAAARAGVFSKIEKDGWTDLVLVNTEALPASVTLTAYDDSGAVVTTQTFTVNGFAKAHDFAMGFFSQSINTATYITYSADRNMVGFQMNGSSDYRMVDGLPAM